MVEPITVSWVIQCSDWPCLTHMFHPESEVGTNTITSAHNECPQQGHIQTRSGREEMAHFKGELKGV